MSSEILIKSCDEASAGEARYRGEVLVHEAQLSRAGQNIERHREALKRPPLGAYQEDMERTRSWSQLTAADRARVLDILKCIDLDSPPDAIAQIARKDLIRVLNMQINGKAALLDIDRAGRSTLDNWHRLVSCNEAVAAKIPGAVSSWRSQSLRSLLAQTARTGETLDQGEDTGTCYLAAFSHILLSGHLKGASVAEYSRQGVDLLVEGKSKVRFSDEPRSYAGRQLDDYVYLRSDLLSGLKGRDLIEAAIQLGHCDRVGAFQDYDEAVEIREINGGVEVQVKGSVGLRPKAALAVIEDMTGSKMDFYFDNPKPGDMMCLRLGNEQDSSGDLEEPLLHGVYIKSVDSEWVYFNDPAGTDSKLSGRFPDLIFDADRSQALYKIPLARIGEVRNFLLRESSTSGYSSIEEDESDEQTLYFPFADRIITLQNGPLAVGLLPSDLLSIVDPWREHKRRYSQRLVTPGIALENKQHILSGLVADPEQKRRK